MKKIKLYSTKEFAVGKNGISYVRDNFKEKFYGMEFEEVSAEGIEVKKLPRDMNDTAIQAELRPNPITLGDLLAFLKDAPHEWYICYIKDERGVLWAVSACWDSDSGGWGVGVRSVGYPSRWGAGSRVVSREFSDTQKRTLSPSDTLTLERAIGMVKMAGYKVIKEL